MLRDVYAIVRPSGLRRLAAALLIVVFQAVMQTVAVFSLVPFLSAASDMAAFRASRIGQWFSGAIGGGSDDRVLIWAGLVSLAILISGNLVALAAEYSRNRYAYKIGHDLRVRLITGLLERRYEYFTRVNSSLLTKNLIDDVGTVSSYLVAPALDFVARSLLIVLLVAAVVVIEPMIVVGGGAAVVLYYLAVVGPVRRRAEATSDNLKEDVRALYFETFQILSGVKPIIATGRRQYFIRRAERASEVVAEVMPRVPMYSAIPRSGLEMLVFGGMIVWVLVVLVTGGGLVELLPRIGLVAVVAYRLMPSLQLLFAQVGAMSSARQALEEVTDLLREQDALSTAGPPGTRSEAAGPLHWTREIRFENVSFTYEGAEDPAIDGVSFTIGKGRRVAFVGPTGSGKSTLIDLFLGLLQPTGGRILVDGVPLTANDMPSWRLAVGYVPQELFLLDGTIAENIAFGWGAGELDRQRVAEVADLAQAREFIEDGRSEGFNGVVGERGVRLSGGQRQRLALARALYGEPNILVMDEATSALDPQTEQKVVAALAEAHDQLTIVTVTHRMSTVRNYDCIHYVERGRIVASGDFATLADAHASFREFVT